MYTKSPDLRLIGFFLYHAGPHFSLFRSWSPAIQSLCDVVWIRAPALRRACYALVAVWCSWGFEGKSGQMVLRHTHTWNCIILLVQGGLESHDHPTNGKSATYSYSLTFIFGDPNRWFVRVMPGTCSPSAFMCWRRTGFVGVTNSGGWRGYLHQEEEHLKR